MTAIYDALGLALANREAKGSTAVCLLLILARTAPDLFRLLGGIPRPPQTRDSVPLADLSVHQRLREISEKIDELLKRTEKP